MREIKFCHSLRIEPNAYEVRFNLNLAQPVSSSTAHHGFSTMKKKRNPYE